jgi:hypothetical protein
VANGGLRGYNSFGEMNLAEIIEELPKLTAEEPKRSIVRAKSWTANRNSK